MDKAAIQKRLRQKFGKGGTRTGGKGTVRRKKKAFRKSTTQDDKRLQSVLKKLNVNNIPAIEEVNLFKQDGQVIHFANPKVQASIAANTYVVSGDCETKKLPDLLPGILNQLGPDNLENLKNIANSYNAQGGDNAATDSDSDVPELVENFENFEAVAQGTATGGADVSDDDDDDSDSDGPPELVEQTTELPEDAGDVDAPPALVTPNAVVDPDEENSDSADPDDDAPAADGVLGSLDLGGTD